jgi:hypothetical protein
MGNVRTAASRKIRKFLPQCIYSTSESTLRNIPDICNYTTRAGHTVYTSCSDILASRSSCLDKKQNCYCRKYLQVDSFRIDMS